MMNFDETLTEMGSFGIIKERKREIKGYRKALWTSGN